VWLYVCRGGVVRIAVVILLAIGIVLAPGCRKPNHAPDAPAVPSGPTSCAVGVEYTFSSSAADPDGDSVAIRFDWGDGDTSDWSAYVAAGDTVTGSHAWSAYAAYDVKAQTRDMRRAASSWSNGRRVSVARRWSRTLGGPANERAGSVVETSDGGYMIAAWFQSSSSFWLIKAGADGDTEWTRSYGVDSCLDAYSVRQTLDGGYIAVGLAECLGGHGGVCLVKTDEQGGLVWDTVMGRWGDINGYSVEQTRDSGYVIVGATRSYGQPWDAWLEKTDQRGREQWNRTLPGGNYECGYCVKQTSDGGYVFAGYTSSAGAGSDDFWLVRTDDSGATAWEQTFGGAGKDRAFCVLETQDGGFIVVGDTDDNGSGTGLWLIKTDASGIRMWDRTFGGSSRDRGRSVQETQDGGYIIAGSTMSYSAGAYDAWLIKTNANGDTVWTRTFGGTGDDIANSVQQTQDGGYIITGYTMSFGAGGQDVWLIKTDAEGRVDEGGGK
jgi:hypothetical protein